MHRMRVIALLTAGSLMLGVAKPMESAGLSDVVAQIESDQPGDRPRIRDLGVTPGILPTGPLNAITDVLGVRVGHRTIIEGDSIRTGVTAILPHDGNLFQQKVPAAVYVGNGFGKAAGFLQVQELGNLETPIVLTNTLAVGRALEGSVRWTLALSGNENVRSVNAVVGECNDARLNDIRAMAVTVDDVIAAINAAEAGPVAEGSVGGGTGMVMFGYKGGIGTASRVLPESLGGWTVGALVQANFGGVLTIDGVRAGEALGRYPFRDHLKRKPTDANPSDNDGSIIIVLATDAPLSSRNLERIARRAIMGLARTGSFMSNGSGDFVIAFSTAYRIAHDAADATMTIQDVPNDRMSPLFLAAVEATEEAIYNALTAAQTMQGHGGVTVEAIDIEALRSRLRK